MTELLDGLEGAARAERAELIDWLLEQGVTIEEIGATGTPPFLLATRRVVGDDGVYVSARETATRYGLDLDLLQRLQRAVGLAGVDDPDAAVHMRADAEAAARIKEFLDLGLDPDNLVAVARVLADGLANTAEVMRYTALAAVLEPGATELEIAQRSQALVSRLVPLLGPLVEDILLVQLRHMMETEAVSASERSAGSALPGARVVTVAFADLVGFTRFGEEVPPEDLEHLANRLAGHGREVAVPPVRFVKTIGDAVMLVCPHPEPLLDALLRLVELADGADDFLRLRAGAATGPAVSRAGDWFGAPVNLASRVTGVARPGAVLVSDTVQDAVGAETGSGFRWSFAGARRLKGISGEVKLFRVRRDERLS
ncbi:adenylate/guanylate cyclase domain-containing protein [Mycolicibacillus trivialis]